MKVEVHIDSHFQEEAVTITAPALSARVEKIRDFVEELDQKGRLRAKKDGEAYLIESQIFQRFYIENRQVIGDHVRSVYSNWTTLSTIRRLTDLLSQNFPI